MVCHCFVFYPIVDHGIAKNNVAMKMLGEMEINPLTFWTLAGGMPLIVVIMETISYSLVRSFLCGML